MNFTLSEVFSPPRVAPIASELGMKSGKSYDILTGFNFLVSRVRNEVRQELDRDRPDVLIFSRVQSVLRMLRLSTDLVADLSILLPPVVVPTPHCDILGMEGWKCYLES